MPESDAKDLADAVGKRAEFRGYVTAIIEQLTRSVAELERVSKEQPERCATHQERLVTLFKRNEEFSKSLEGLREDLEKCRRVCTENSIHVDKIDGLVETLNKVEVTLGKQSERTHDYDVVKAQVNANARKLERIDVRTSLIALALGTIPPAIFGIIKLVIWLTSETKL